MLVAWLSAASKGVQDGEKCTAFIIGIESGFVCKPRWLPTAAKASAEGAEDSEHQESLESVCKSRQPEARHARAARDGADEWQGAEPLRRSQNPAQTWNIRAWIQQPKAGSAVCGPGFG